MRDASPTSIVRRITRAPMPLLNVAGKQYPPRKQVHHGEISITDHIASAQSTCVVVDEKLWLVMHVRTA